MTSFRARRRLRAACVAAGATCLVAAGTAVLGGQAEASAPGSRFQSLGLIGEAGGARIVFTQKETKQPDGTAEGDTPFAQVSLSTIAGRAFASEVWPGTLAGNFGSTFTLLTGQTLPFDANDPVRAQTQTGSGDASQTTPVPGGSMSATSTLTKVVADAVMGANQTVGPGSLGTTHAHALAEVTGVNSAFSDTRSTTEDVVLAGGAIRIGSITSHAHVTTNGRTSKGTGRTVVSDMTVGGVPVTVDGSGVHANGQGTPLSSAQDQVNKVIGQTRTQIFLSSPHTSTTPAGMTYDAGSLIIAFDDGGFFVEFGGAKSIAGSTLNSIYKPPPPPTIPPTPPTTTGGSTTGTTGGGYVPAPPITGGTTGGTTTGGPQPAFPPTTNAGFDVPRHPLSPGWIVTVLLGSGLIAAGLRRFPDRVLEQASTPCPLGDK